MREANRSSESNRPESTRAHASESTVRRDIDAIREDLNSLREDLASAMHDLIDAGREGGAEAKRRVQDVIRDRLESLGEAVEGLGDRTKSIYHEFSRGVERRPVRSVAIAAGVGAVVGAVVMGIWGGGGNERTRRRHR